MGSFSLQRRTRRGRFARTGSFTRCRMHPRFWSLFFFGADQSVKGSPVRCQFKECHHHQISARPKRQPVEFPTNLQRLTTWEWDSITNSVTHFTSFATDCWFDVLGRWSWWQNTVCACMKIRELTSADSSSGFVLFWTKSPQTGQCSVALSPPSDVQNLPSTYFFTLHSSGITWWWESQWGASRRCWWCSDSVISLDGVWRTFTISRVGVLVFILLSQRRDVKCQICQRKKINVTLVNIPDDVSFAILW